MNAWLSQTSAETRSGNPASTSFSILHLFHCWSSYRSNRNFDKGVIDWYCGTQSPPNWDFISTRRNASNFDRRLISIFSSTYFFFFSRSCCAITLRQFFPQGIFGDKLLFSHWTRPSYFFNSHWPKNRPTYSSHFFPARNNLSGFCLGTRLKASYRCNAAGSDIFHGPIIVATQASCVMWPTLVQQHRQSG